VIQKFKNSWSAQLSTLSLSPVLISSSSSVRLTSLVKDRFGHKVEQIPSKPLGVCFTIVSSQFVLKKDLAEIGPKAVFRILAATQNF